MFKKLLELQKNSLATFSNYKVACVIETENGAYSGVNIEPDVLNLGICAERNAIFNAIFQCFSTFSHFFITKKSSFSLLLFIFLPFFAYIFAKLHPKPCSFFEISDYSVAIIAA